MILTWCLPVAIALHNLEEAIWLPGWAQEGGRWRRPVDAGRFRAATAALTVSAFLIALWAYIGGPGSLGQYLLASYALGQGLNVILPHLVVTLATRRYAPGTLSGLLGLLPAASAYLARTFALGQLRAGPFLLTTAVFVPAVLVGTWLLLRADRGRG